MVINAVSSRMMKNERQNYRRPSIKLTFIHKKLIYWSQLPYSII